MPIAGCIEPCGAALGGDFAHQTCLDQIAQIIVRRGAGRARIGTIDGFENFGRRGMPVALHEECHNRVALRSTPQAAVLQGLFDRHRVHMFGIYLI